MVVTGRWYLCSMAGRDLKQLFRAYRDGDELAFRRAAQTLIEEAEANQHLALARDLKQILAGGGQITLSDTVMVPPPPMDREGEWPLAEVRHPEHYFADLILRKQTQDQLAEIAEEVRHWDELEKHGVPRRRRILLYGPPGCGKSSAAHALAAELGWPLITVRVEAVISSYLGETATNLHRVFDYARAGTWVVLFDEFDALGRARDDPTEHGEIKRVVSAFLQLLDSFRGSSLIVAATNHEQMLDPALWRRFDEVVEFPKPTVPQIRQLLKMRLRMVDRQPLGLEAASSALKGLPHSAVEKAAWDARRFALIDGRDRMNRGDLERAVAAAVSRPW